MLQSGQVKWELQSLSDLDGKWTVTFAKAISKSEGAESSLYQIEEWEERKWGRNSHKDHGRLKNFEASVVKWSFFVSVEVIRILAGNGAERKTVSQEPKFA